MNTGAYRVSYRRVRVLQVSGLTTNLVLTPAEGLSGQRHHAISSRKLERASVFNLFTKTDTV